MVAHQAVVWSSNSDYHPPNPDCDESFRFQVTGFSTRYFDHQVDVFMFLHFDAKQSPLSPVDWSFLQRLNSSDFATFPVFETRTRCMQSLSQNPDWLRIQSGRYIYFRYDLPSSQYGDFLKMMYNLHLQQNWLEVVHFQKTPNEFGDISYFFKACLFHSMFHLFLFPMTERPGHRNDKHSASWQGEQRSEEIGFLKGVISSTRQFLKSMVWCTTPPSWGKIGWTSGPKHANKH